MSTAARTGTRHDVFDVYVEDFVGVVVSIVVFALLAVFRRPERPRRGHRAFGVVHSRKVSW